MPEKRNLTARSFPQPSASSAGSSAQAPLLQAVELCLYLTQQDTDDVDTISGPYLHLRSWTQGSGSTKQSVTFDYARQGEWDKWIECGSRIADTDAEAMKHARETRRVSRIVTYPHSNGWHSVDSDLNEWMKRHPASIMALERLLGETAVAKSEKKPSASSELVRHLRKELGRTMESEERGEFSWFLPEMTITVRKFGGEDVQNNTRQVELTFGVKSGPGSSAASDSAALPERKESWDLTQRPYEKFRPLDYSQSHLLG